MRFAIWRKLIATYIFHSGEEIQLKPLSYQIAICTVVLSLLLGPVAPAFAQESTPQTPAAEIEITPTLPPTETPTPQPSETPIPTEDGTAEPAVETVVPVEIAPADFVLTLTVNTTSRAETGVVTLLWEIQGELPEEDAFMLQITLPQGYALSAGSETLAEQAEQELLIPVTENSGSVTLQGTGVQDIVTFYAACIMMKMRSLRRRNMICH
jgi:hypothetical protein